MASMEPTQIIDPLQAYMRQHLSSQKSIQIPLASTFIDVWIRSGMIVAKTYRTFQNTENCSIEAALTYPVPVDATMFSLEAKVGGRILKAEARKREVARARYEDAVCDGSLAVLHEELLRGVHMLSVANLSPEAAVDVTNTWVAPLSLVAGQGRFRIPLTVGDIYGRSNLPETDELASGGAPQIGRLRLVKSDVPVTLEGKALGPDAISISMSRPIDLRTSMWEPRPIVGRTRDGRIAGLTIDAADDEVAPLSVAILVDHSGSMDTEVHFRDGNVTYHDLAVSAVTDISHSLKADDFVDLWEFDDQPNHVGSVIETTSGDTHARLSMPNKRLAYLTRKLSGPRGGTEIGCALNAVIDRSQASDILLLTDGKSYELDVHALAKSGKRISVILLGEDSLEANVGHLAALTGGSIFVAAPHDVSSAVSAAIKHMRSSSGTVTGDDKWHTISRNGVVVHVGWFSGETEPQAEELSHAAVAMAAALTLTKLEEEAAAKLAEQEGLVTHLTSLVLVDEESRSEGDLPKFRKVRLPNPISSSRPALAHGIIRAGMDRGAPLELADDVHELLLESDGAWDAIRRLFKMVWRSFVDWLSKFQN